MLEEFRREFSGLNQNQLIHMTAERKKRKSDEESIQNDKLDSEMIANTQIMLKKIQDLEKMFITEFNTQKDEKKLMSSVAKQKG